jgi:hypothetical protein
MPNKILIKFIKQSRKKGFSDHEIRQEMLKKNYPVQEIEKSFLSLEPKPKYKNQITLFLSNDIINKLQKRAKKNLFTLSEQIEDILRRSCINKTSSSTEKIDDKLLLAFSRPQRKKKNN